VIGTCQSCHNGSLASGKPGDHLPTTAPCDDCHTTTAWLPARFDHADVTGLCVSCHNGSIAMGKPANHIPTSTDCVQCHMTLAWTPASIDHTGVTGACANCHNGTIATGKPSGHFVTNLSCESCHSTTRWSPISFTHSSPNYPTGHRSRLECTSCHRSNSQLAPWTFPAYQPDCAGCHANDFKSEPHKKVDTPRVLYTVSELRDCTGSCHIYTNASLTTIKERRNSEHRASEGEF
jgi:hypothetical protein